MGSHQSKPHRRRPDIHSRDKSDQRVIIDAFVDENPWILHESMPLMENDDLKTTIKEVQMYSLLITVMPGSELRRFSRIAIAVMYDGICELANNSRRMQYPDVWSDKLLQKCQEFPVRWFLPGILLWTAWRERAVFLDVLRTFFPSEIYLVALRTPPVDAKFPPGKACDGDYSAHSAFLCVAKWCKSPPRMIGVLFDLEIHCF